MIKNKEIFVVYKDKTDNYFSVEAEGLEKIELAVIRPSYKVRQTSEQTYAKAFREFVDAGALVRAQLDDILRERKLWNDIRQQKYDELNNKISSNLLKIKKGNIKLKDAINLGKEVIKYRSEMLQLTLEKTELDKNTAEAQAEQVRFNYFVSACTVYNDNKKPFFSSFEDYMEQDEKSNPVVNLAGAAFWRLTTGLNDDVRKEWPEYQFLTKYKVVNDKLQFINSQGKLVDMEGRLINENGRFINEQGAFININGDLVDDKGDLNVESQPFLDDDGKPITV